jgi:phosphonoacetaldehyde hydrolase
MRVRAIILDWAGTAVDFGSLCPVGAFQSAFYSKGLAVSAEHIHRFMGIRKREHIQAVLSLPEISAKWEAIHGRKPDDQAVNAVYREAEKLLLETVTDFSTPTPHLVESLATVRRRGLKVGSATGYTTPIMERLVPAAKRKGFDPDDWVASDQVPLGRPWPWMIFKSMEHLEVWPPAAVVKVGDTVADVEEANNAGVWSVAVVESSSLVGKSQSALQALPAKDRASLIRHTSRRLAEAGAHYVIKNLSQLEETIEEINRRLERDMSPPRLARSQRDDSLSGDLMGRKALARAAQIPSPAGCPR